MRHLSTGIHVAVKVMIKDPEIEKQVYFERQALIELTDTRYNLSILAAFHDQNNFYLVTVSCLSLTFRSTS